MNAVIFEPTNECIGSFTVEDLDQMAEGFAHFLRKGILVADKSYIECSGRTWTLLSQKPILLREGRISAEELTKFQMRQAKANPPESWKGIAIGGPVIGFAFGFISCLMYGWGGISGAIQNGVCFGVIAGITGLIFGGNGLGFLFGLFLNNYPPTTPRANIKTYDCLCCQHRTIYFRACFECCPVCFWVDDGQDDDDADIVRRGLNGGLSLTKARENFKTHGASDPVYVGKVRPPEPDEIIDEDVEPAPEPHRDNPDHK